MYNQPTTPPNPVWENYWYTVKYSISKLTYYNYLHVKTGVVSLQAPFGILIL